MALLQRAFAAVRQGVLSNVRYSPFIIQQKSTEAVAPAVSLQFLRFFADASYLDKNEVTDRVLNVVKNFEKVDSAKVRICQGLIGWQGLTSRLIAIPSLGMGRVHTNAAPDAWCVTRAFFLCVPSLFSWT